MRTLSGVLAVILSPFAALRVNSAQELCAPRAVKGLSAALGYHPERSEGSARRRDKQPVRCLDRCPGGTVAHASLQMSASTQKVLTSTTAQYKMMYQSLMRQCFTFLRVALH